MVAIGADGGSAKSRQQRFCRVALGWDLENCPVASKVYCLEGWMLSIREGPGTSAVLHKGGRDGRVCRIVGVHRVTGLKFPGTSHCMLRVIVSGSV